MYIIQFQHPHLPFHLCHSSLHPYKSFPHVDADSFCFVTHWDSPAHDSDFGTGEWSLEVSTVAIQLKTLVGTVLVSVS